MSLRQYQKDVNKKNETIKQILDVDDIVISFRNTLAAALVGIGAPKQAELQAICPDASAEDMLEASEQSAKLQSIVDFIDNLKLPPNLPA